MRRILSARAIAIGLLLPAIGLAFAEPVRALATAAPARGDSFCAQVRPLLDEYCSKCHGNARAKGGVNLAGFTNTVSVYREPGVWKRVIDKLQAGEMPPEGKPRPGQAQRDELVRWCRQTLDDLEQGRFAPDPGRVLIHRLSRTEYNSTIRDLLGVGSNPANNFPSEGGGGEGFDNNADTLFIPPILMERYLAAAGAALDQAPKSRLFFVKRGWLSSDRGAAKEIIQHFATRGFRRPVEPSELARLVGVYDKSRQRGKDFEGSVKTALSAVLISPNFLFRVEADQPASGPYRISDYELASRISYFIWSSMPDEELFRLAAEKKLHQPEVIDQQVRRMIRDPKSRSFTESFASQWLRVRELKTAAQPDPNRFPAYTPALRDALYDEVVEFFDSLIRDDASLIKALNADYTFVNADLAALYGIPGVDGNKLRRVELTDPRRGGLLAMGAVLTLTSYPQRTSPVLRGKWVLEAILGTPPPPPPPLVKSLPPDDTPVDGLTLRQRLEKHRQQPECATCHVRMDPLGFGLENFDPIGRWRTRIGDQAVDASGVLPDGEKFEGPAELKKVLLGRKDEFIRNISEKMLAYGLGRGLEYYDMPTVRKISEALAAKDYRSSVLLTEIVKSFPFQYRRNAPIEQSSK